MTARMPADGRFSSHFREQFLDLLRYRRDVRRFQTEPLPAGLLEEILGLTRFAPSVGLSEPWRYVYVKRPETRADIRANFAQANARALAGYSGERAVRYAGLKLAGLDSAPVHLAVFADRTTEQGAGLGCQTMPEMLEYSTVAAITTLWLAARAYGVGIGWVSILNPERVKEILEVSKDWQLVAYLCIGYPEQESTMPELEQAGWEKRREEIRLLER
jgi:5,6-dimethylbenzimidazole synthase